MTLVWRKVLEIPGNGEEELAGLYGVEEVAEAGREEEGWHSVHQVHAEQRQTVRPDIQTGGQYRQTVRQDRQTGGGGSTIDRSRPDRQTGGGGQYRQTIRPDRQKVGQYRQMVRPDRQTVRPGRWTGGLGGLVS